MATSHYADEVSLFSFKNELTKYSWETYRKDAFAAISVALLTVPQAMAYSLLAGLPLTCGLYAAIYSSILAALFGSSRHLIVGPSNAIAILIQSGTSEILFTHFRGLEGYERDLASVNILTQLCLLVGILQILAAGCKLGRLTQFVSHSVIIGYIAGTAVAVVINQLFTFLGISRAQGVHSLYENGIYLISNLSTLHWPTAIVGVISLTLYAFMRKIDRRIPAPLIMLLFSAVLVYVVGFSRFDEIRKILMVGDVGYLDRVFPGFELPFFDTKIMNSLLSVAFAVALLSVMETTSVAKSIAANSGQRLSTNQEIFGIGLGNLMSSFISAMPVSGSPSRTCVNFAQGAQTRLAAIFSALFIASILYFFSNLIMHIPLAALSALLLASSVHIVNARQFFLCLKATRSDAFVLGITMLSCIFFSLDIAFFIGIILSITLYLKKAAVPQVVEYEVGAEGELHKIEASKPSEGKKIRLIKVEGELFFGAADIFQTTLKSITEDDTTTKVIILQLKNARDIDATACLALQHLSDYLKNSRRHLLACGITSQVWEVFSDSGLIAEMGKENLFVFDERQPQQYILKALARAHQLLNEKQRDLEATDIELEQVLEEFQDRDPEKAPLS